MSRKRRGINFERRVKKYLEDRGWFAVRCAGSKPVDVIAMRKGEVRIIECKINGKIDPETRRNLERIEKLTNFPVFLAYREGRETVIVPFRRRVEKLNLRRKRR